MKAAPIETARFALAGDPPAVNHVLHLSAEDDPQWAGLVTLAPAELYALPSLHRHDIYVLRGSVDANGALLDEGGFASLYDASVLQAGNEGVALFIYRERAHSPHETITQRADQREWHAGRNPGMRVAPLSSSAHSLSLVAWQPGTRTRDHGHLTGEEILVISGELRSYDQRYPAGTWIRLHPGARHDPFTDVPTVIMLRHGHLKAVKEPIPV